jgi:hypothetical protein
VTPQQIAETLGKARHVGNEWLGLCPCHDDHNASLSVTQKNGKLLVTCRAGCEQTAVIAALKQRGLWSGARDRNQDRREYYKGRQIVAVYDYQDEDGRLLFQVCRTDDKQFPQRRPDGAGGWKWGIEGIRRVPYRLPQLLAARTKANGVPARVYIVEGEKGVHCLERWGMTATCSPGGAGKWREEYNDYFIGTDAVAFPDNDDAGRKHVATVAANLAPIAAAVRVVPLRGLPEKGDIYNWIVDNGGSQSELEALIARTPPFEPHDVDDNNGDQPPVDPIIQLEQVRRQKLAQPKTPKPCPANGSDDLYTDPEVALPGTEDEVALEFSRRHDGQLRYVNVWHQWLRWEGAIWHRIADLSVFHAVRKIAREFAKANDDKKLGKDAATAAIERIARNDPRHDTPTDTWDTDDEILNNPKVTPQAALRDAERNQSRRDPRTPSP